MVSATLGHYRVGEKLGSGGMGEVYRARDPRLNRDVAIKVLPDEVRQDPKRRERFLREAEVVAGLTHPHICVLHDIGQHEGTDFLVMELLEGETLAARLDRGPLPLDQALEYGAEIADALAAAHRAGVSHRDLKPGNVMLTRSGAKLLDFGLAKLKPTPHTGESTTLTQGITGQGAIVGTLQYMAPEQLEGRETDTRTDIFAFGGVLYEMLTRQRAFKGESQASLIGSILKDDPAPIGPLQPLAPASLDRIVRRCLQKDPDARWQSADDLAAELRWVREERSDRTTSESRRPVEVARTRSRRLGIYAVAVAAGALLLALGYWGAGRDAVAPPPDRSFPYELPITPAETLSGAGYYEGALTKGRPTRTALALSPDGSYLVFVGMLDGRQQLFLSALDGSPAVPLEGTEGAELPFFSPDGQWVAFWSDGVGGTSVREGQAPRALRKVPIEGGPAQEIVTTPRVAGASWSDLDEIVFNCSPQDGTLWKVPAGGGDAIPLLLPDLSPDSGILSYRLPHFLPGGRHLLYTETSIMNQSRVAVLSLETGQSDPLIDDGAWDARYVAPGHLVFMRSGNTRDGILYAVPFDLRERRVTGSERAVVGDVMHASRASNSDVNTLAGQFTVSATGHLAYISGGVFGSPERQPAWFDRSGRPQELPTDPGYTGSFRISEDQRRFVMTRGGYVVWNIERNEEEHRIEIPEGQGPQGWTLWRGDGEIVTGGRGFHGLRADGSGQPRRLTNFEYGAWPADWGPDGELLFLRQLPGEDRLLSWWPGTDDVEPVLENAGYVMYPILSPDKRWLAYSTNTSGQNEVYVQPYPSLEWRLQISKAGGTMSRWTLGGQELLYLEPGFPRRLMAVDMSALPAVGSAKPEAVGDPQFLFEAGFGIGEPLVDFDVTSDGQRILAYLPLENPTPPPPLQIDIIVNWLAELREKVPVG